MPLQNRVDPFGELFASPARGTLMGNRGGRIHDERRQLSARRWASKQWICCKLAFNGRHRDVWGDGYTELFFLDEVTAFAAGHRPCFECRRKDAERFASLCAGADPISAHSRTRVQPSAGPSTGSSGNPALGPRFRGDERDGGRRASASEMDNILHAERLDHKAKRTYEHDIDTLPDGAMIAIDGAAFGVRGDRLLRWSPAFNYPQFLLLRGRPIQCRRAATSRAT
jgi:hypothetical protein